MSSEDNVVIKMGLLFSGCQSKLYIPSNLNIDLILWHIQLNVYA